VLRGIDMTQDEFATRIGVTQSYLSLVEHGHGEVGAAVLLAISREFGKSIEWLLTGTEAT
jgi:transcriptional regulator with XRE-family HTH domain